MISTNEIAKGWQNGNGESFSEDQKVPLSSLSELTGFPVDFIKKELLLDSEDLSMRDLRASMINYLNKKSDSILKN